LKPAYSVIFKKKVMVCSQVRYYEQNVTKSSYLDTEKENFYDI
jgi:hypothetical protein